MSAQPTFSPGFDCVFKYSLTGADSTAPSVGDKILRLVDASWSDDMAELDVTDRGAGGYVQTVPGLRTLSVSAKLIYDPSSTDFNDINLAYGSRQRIVISIGDNAGNFFTMCAYVASFSINQGLQEAMTADITIKPTRGGFTPQWVKSA